MREDLIYLEGAEEGNYISRLYFDKALYRGMEDDAWYLTLNDFLLGHTMRFLDDEALQDGRN